MQNSGFIQKVYKKIDKLDAAKIRQIISELSTEKELYKLPSSAFIHGRSVTAISILRSRRCLTHR
jgi:hypothetical protein